MATVNLTFIRNDDPSPEPQPQVLTINPAHTLAEIGNTQLLAAFGMPPLVNQEIWSFQQVGPEGGRILQSDRPVRDLGLQPGETINFEIISPQATLLTTAWQETLDTFASCPYVQVNARDPRVYVVTFNLRGIVGLHGNQPRYHQLHIGRLRFSESWPRPGSVLEATMLTPLFHPHVHPWQASTGGRRAAVCLYAGGSGVDHPVSIILRLARMIQFHPDLINWSETGAMNPEAKDWARRARDRGLLPVDNSPLPVRVGG